MKKEFPFKGVLDLSQLIEYWKSNLASNDVFAAFPTADILKRLDETPELSEPITDLKILDKHRDIIGLLMSAVFPPALVDTDLAAALIPFDMEGFYATPGYQKVFDKKEKNVDYKVNVPDKSFRTGKIVNAAMLILNKFYNKNIKIEKPIILSVADKDFDQLEKVYKLDINMQFVNVKKVGKLPELSDEIISELLDNMYDCELWLKHISPSNFEFHGFAVVRLVDVTVEEMLSSIKYDLLKKDAVTCSNSFSVIQSKVRSIFHLPELKMGLSYFDPQNNIVTNYGDRDWSSFIISDDQQEKMSCDLFDRSIYEIAFAGKKPVVVEDLLHHPNKSNVEKNLLKKGIKNIVIAPLIIDDQVIGMLELGTPYPGKLNPINAALLENVLPMFTAAVRRVLLDMQINVRAIIQKECTAIHPTVEWKFLEEGYRIMWERRNGVKAELDNIIFNDVYPIYGLSDIRNSSGTRSLAIQQDLQRNINEVKHVINAVLEYKKMPILDEINHRANQVLNNISSDLHAGDESGVLEFLHQEINPLFNHLKTSETELRPIIENYEALLDQNLGVIYDKRKDFEVSLTRINDTISTYLDQVEEKSQEIFPHYFEKYKTDGVEYNIYIGNSLVKEGGFDMIYLRNMRLWQLITMCEIATKTETLKSDLAQPLDITQLILVHSDSLAIKFRKDEKHFDVDGAYNIRYEIVKKRIDKAYIMNTKERLTQPGKIAIVYSQQKDKQEYFQYIDYLQSINYLTDELEELELEELQGAQGLKALRVTVNTQASAIDFGSDILKEVFQQMEA